MQLPLTFQQQWLWDLLQKRHDWNCSVTHAFRLKGELNVPVLRRSIAEVVRRHASLHTRIVTVDGVPRQETDDPRAGRLEVTPVGGTASAEREENARRLFEEFVQAQGDPGTGPLLGLRLLEFGDREHWLLMALHRLTADCFSADQISHELWSLYREFLHDRPSPFPEDPPQYADYAIWQRSTYDDWLKRHAGYWQERLADASRIWWPVDQSVAGTARGVIGRMSGWFSSTLSAGLRDLSRRVRALSATIMLAVYVAVVWRRCRQRDFVVPFNIAGRQSEHKYVVGYFSHILYLRMQLDDKQTFSELLGRVSNEFFRALAHQDFGTMAVQQPELLAGGFFQWLTWHPHAAVGTRGLAEPSDLTVEQLPLGNFGEGLSALPAGMVDVDITFFDTPAGIYAAGLYRADLFAADTMNRFVDDLRSAAELFVQQPDAPISTICPGGSRTEH